MIHETSAGTIIRTGPGVKEPTKRPEGYPATPNLTKMLEVKEQSQAIGEFLDWCSSRGQYLCEYREGHEFPSPVRISIHRLLAEFFDIDYDAANKEQEAVLEYVRRIRRGY